MSDTTSTFYSTRAKIFETYMRRTVPDYDSLLDKAVGVADYYLREATSAIDIGCGTAGFIIRLSEAYSSRASIKFTGIELEPEFSNYWTRFPEDPELVIGDARSYDGYHNLSFVSSIFALSHMPRVDRFNLLVKIFDGMRPGGALLLADRVLANSSQMQASLTPLFYGEAVERQYWFGDTIAGQEDMHEALFKEEREASRHLFLSTRSDRDSMLRTIGFRATEEIWSNYPYSAVLAVK